MRVSEIRVKRIRENQGLDVLDTNLWYLTVTNSYSKMPPSPSTLEVRSFKKLTLSRPYCALVREPEN